MLMNSLIALDSKNRPIVSLSATKEHLLYFQPSTHSCFVLQKIFCNCNSQKEDPSPSLESSNINSTLENVLSFTLSKERQYKKDFRLAYLTGLDHGFHYGKYNGTANLQIRN